MQVSVQWQDKKDGKWVDDGEPLQIKARETPRLLFVPMPSGWVKRVKKFATFDRPRTRCTEHWAEHSRRFVISWDPATYSKP